MNGWLVQGNTLTKNGQTRRANYSDTILHSNASSGGCANYSYNGVVLFEHANCNGRSKPFSTPLFTNLPDFNDLTSSIHVGSGWSVKVYEHNDRGGSSRCITSSMWDLSKDYYTSGNTGLIINDTISSVDVFHNSNCGSGSGSGGGPPGYTYCADEGGRCNFNGTADVAYGANGKFNYKYSVSNGIDCNNTVFGDPIPGTRKACYYKLKSSGGPPGYTYCADEGGRCNFNGIADVAYGANGKFSYKYDVSNGIDCNNGIFGDPIPGTRKACYYKLKSGGPPGYSYCADEGGRCDFNGYYADVAYGANGKFNYKYNVMNGIDCNNTVFGDPIWGVRKACYYKIRASIPTLTPTFTPSPLPTWTPTPQPTNTPPPTPTHTPTLTPTPTFMPSNTPTSTPSNTPTPTPTTTPTSTPSNTPTPTAPAPPAANFTASPTSGTAPLTVQFTDQSTGSITSWSWDFGDGTTSTVQNPQHTYTAIGTYTVSLTVSGPGGSDTYTRTNIDVTAPPNATVVHIAPPTASANVGVPITVGVAITNVTDLGSFQFTLTYSPSLVTVQGVTLGEFPGSTGRSFSPVGPTIDNNNGQTTFGAFSLGSTPAGASGSGTLAYVRLLPHQAGTATVRLQGVQVTDVSGQSIQVATQNGVLHVNACLDDFDGDGDVDILDVQQVAYRWNTATGNPLYDSRYDLDQDGDIDILDVQRTAYRWGTQCGGAAPGKPHRKAGGGPPPATLSIQPSAQQVSTGDVFTTSVVISDAVDLGAFEFTLAYTPTVVKVITATLGTFPASTGRTFTPIGTQIDTIAGTMTFGAYSLGSSPTGPSGNGTLAVLTLEALSSGTSDLIFRSAQVSDRTGNAQTIAAMHKGQITVTAATYRIFLPVVVR